MIRVKDIEKSLKFYQDILGMSRVRTIENKDAGFNLYFLAYTNNQALTSDSQIPHSEGLLELTWNYGTEKEADFKYHNGNDQPQGFGHLCISVDNIEQACQRLDDLQCNWKKRLTDGRMKNVAFVLDPDGYWIEVVENERLSGSAQF
jgi:lactoylglutathione lyase